MDVLLQPIVFGLDLGHLSLELRRLYTHLVLHLLLSVGMSLLLVLKVYFKVFSFLFKVNDLVVFVLYQSI